MGDRGNIIVLPSRESAPVYLYTHWGGTGLPDVVSRALAKQWRWTDPSYLTRIIFDTLTEGSHGTETGYGIDTEVGDNEHDYLVVDPMLQEVRVLEYTREADNNNPLAAKVKGFVTFEQAAASPEAIRRWFK
jgi:hypothetical protein